ncbi:DUF1467 family protein [Polycladidibacter hongkongensis]|uniref:DUF1467 family protein n=1 Tax=Polycladidibacter hongkongensis TaxID=1647556 RepID=UPI0008353E34|nr:DUF1467 family protein [Pseudovibrio hongkongensis]
MSLALGIAVYFMIWWVLFLAILPFGVRTQGEEGEVVHGSVESAPAKPMLLRKALINSVVSGVVFVALYVFLESGLGTRYLPMIDRFMGH